MQELIGTTIKTPSWLEQLRAVTHLVFFETPLVTQMRSASGENFLKVWCDVSDGVDRYILFSLSHENMESYRTQTASLRDLMAGLQDGFVYFLDEDAGRIAVKIVSGEKIPVEYLPDADSLFDPLVTAEAQESPTYEISLNNRWDLEELKALPHIFSQVYALLFCLSDARPEQTPMVKGAFAAYPWRGGFSRVHFYKHLHHIIPAEFRPQIKTMHFASPGWIELELDKSIGCNIGELVDSYIAQADDIGALAAEIKKELTRRNLRGAKAKAIADDSVGEDDLRYCAAAFDSVAELWGFSKASQIRKLSINDLAALKILLSFQRRVESLARFQMTEMAHFEK